MVAPGDRYVPKADAGEDCPTGCTMVDKVKMHGDPMFMVNGSSRHFWTKAGEASQLMSWRVDDIDSAKLAALDNPKTTQKEREALRKELVDTSWTLKGTTFDRPDTGNQWFDQLSVSRDDKTVLDVKFTGGKLHVSLDGQDINFRENKYMPLRSATQDLELEMTPDDEQLEVSTSVGHTFKIWPSMARDLTKNKDLTKYRHLNIDFPQGLPAGAAGLFAELAGVVQVSNATKMLLQRPVSAAMVSLACDCPGSVPEPAATKAELELHQTGGSYEKSSTYKSSSSFEGPEHPYPRQSRGFYSVKHPDKVDPTAPVVTAPTQAEDFAHVLATGGDIQRAFTCMVDDIQAVCPGAMSLAQVSNFRQHLKPKPNEKWVFYGPSYMGQILQVVIAANREDIVSQTCLYATFPDITPTEEALSADCAGPDQPFRAASSLSAADEEHECGVDGHSGECNVVSFDNCTCAAPCMDYPHITLANGAQIIGIVNVRVFQDTAQPSVMKLLQDFLNQPDFVIDQVFYMEAHGSAYFAEQCAAKREGRGVEESKVRDEHGVDMCYQHLSLNVDMENGARVLGEGETSSGKEGVQASATTAVEYVQCVRSKLAFKEFYDHVSKHGTQIMVAAPWAVKPSPELLGSPYVYTAFEAGHKYSCTAGGSSPEQKDYGVGSGVCPPDPSSFGQYKSQYLDEIQPKYRYQSQHPCTLVCETDDAGESSCVPGPAARMAVDMVTRGRKTPIPGDTEDYSGYDDMSTVYAAQMACDHDGVTPAQAAAVTAANADKAAAAAAASGAPAAEFAGTPAAAGAPAAAPAAAAASTPTTPPARTLPDTPPPTKELNVQTNPVANDTSDAMAIAPDGPEQQGASAFDDQGMPAMQNATQNETRKTSDELLDRITKAEAAGREGQETGRYASDELLDRITKEKNDADLELRGKNKPHKDEGESRAFFDSKGACEPYCAKHTTLTWSEKCINDRQCAGCAECAGVYKVDPS